MALLLLLIRDVIRYERMVDAVRYFETRATYNMKTLLHGKRDCRKLLLMKSNNEGRENLVPFCCNNEFL